MTKTKKRNRAKCKLCGDVVESFSTNELKRCKCGAIAVDGGDDYRKRLGDPKNIEEMP